MKHSMSKQTALKGLLLVALAANISWPPFKEALKSVDLASDTAPGGATHRAAETESMNKLSQSPNAIRANTADTSKAVSVQLVSDTASKAKSAPAAQIQKPNNDLMETSLQTICGENYRFTYREVPGALPQTKVSISRAGSREVIAEKIQNGVLEYWMKPDNKAIIDRSLIETVEKRHGDSAACKKDAPKDQKPETVADDKAKKEETEADKKRIADGMKKCTHDSRGERLSESGRTSCLIESISKIDTKESRNGRELKDGAMNELERIVGNLKKNIKSLLFSKDESDREEGEELLTDTIEAVEDQADLLDLDKRRTQKLVKELQKLKETAQAYHENEKNLKNYADNAEQLRLDMVKAVDDYNSIMNDVKTNPFYQQYPGIAQYEMNRAYSNVVNMQKMRMEFESDFNRYTTMGLHKAVLNSQRDGIVTAADLRDQVSEAEKMTRLLKDMSDLNKVGVAGGSSSVYQPGTGTIPSGAAAVRTRAQSAYRNATGGAAPARPSSVNFGNYGLSSMSLPTSAPTALFNNLHSSPRLGGTTRN